jgi:hypothetical protein
VNAKFRATLVSECVYASVAKREGIPYSDGADGRRRTQQTQPYNINLFFVVRGREKTTKAEEF